MEKIIELQKAVYRKILFSHLKKIKNPLPVEQVIESMENIDPENIIIGLKKTDLGMTTDIYLFSSQKNKDILRKHPIPLPFLSWNNIGFVDWNCINYEFSEEGEFTGTKIYIDNFSFTVDQAGGLSPVAYFSEYSGSIPPNAIYFNKNLPFSFVDTDERVQKTIGVKILKKRNALYFNNITYNAFIDFLERGFGKDYYGIAYLKKYDSYLSQHREYHVCYDIYNEGPVNKIVNIGYFLKI